MEVCIGGDGIDDPDAGIDWEPGPRVVKGYDALAFLRTRKGIGDGSDLARIGNQQQYLSRLINKLRSDEVLSNPGTLIGLANTAVNNIEPSESLADPIRIAQLAYTLKDVPFSDITFVQFPVVDDPADNNHVIPTRRRPRPCGRRSTPTLSAADRRRGSQRRSHRRPLGPDPRAERARPRGEHPRTGCHGRQRRAGRRRTAEQRQRNEGKPGHLLRRQRVIAARGSASRPGDRPESSATIEG